MKALHIVRARPDLRAALLSLSCFASSIPNAHAQLAPGAPDPAQPSRSEPAQVQPSQGQASPSAPSLPSASEQPSVATPALSDIGGTPQTPTLEQLQPQPTGAHGGPWTLLSAEQRALDQAPRVRSAQANRDTALAYRTFGNMPRAANPQVNLRALIGKPDDPAATYAVTVGLPFDVAGRRRAWRSEAGYIAEQAEAELASIRNEVRSEARAAYVQVAMAGAARVVAEQIADTARELSERVQARLKANATTALDVALAQSQHAEATANVARAQRTLIEAQAQFRQTLGLPFDQVIEVAPLTQPALPAGLTLEASVRRASEHRKEMLAWSKASERWRAADTRLRREAVGPMTAQLEGESQGNTNRNSSVGAGLSFELPFVFRNQGERAVAAKQADAAAIERELAGGMVERDASASYRRLEAALAELAAIEEDALPAAERTLTMVHTMLDAGVVDYFRLLASRSTAFSLRNRRVEALREAWLCRIALERAIGGWEEKP